jgi:hypothetical protein
MRRLKGRRTWSRYFIYLYENITMTPVEIILRKGGGGRMTVGLNLAKMHCNHNVEMSQ